MIVDKTRFEEQKFCRIVNTNKQQRCAFAVAHATLTA